MDYVKRNHQIANSYYNLGLEKAQIRDLSGAAECLKKSLRFNKYQTDSRNLLGLIYYEMGEVADAIVQWVISLNLQPENNRCDYYLDEIQRKPGRLEVASQNVKKYNQALWYAQTGSYDLAILQLVSAVEENDHYVKAQLLLALLCISQENYIRAGKALRRVLQIDRSNQKALWYMSVVKKNTGRAEIERQQLDHAFSHSRGIGRATALALARDGFDVVVHGSCRSQALQDTLEAAAAFGGHPRMLAFDVRDRDAAARLLEGDIAEHGAYYGIVVNAGITADGTFAAMAPQDWEQVIDTDLNGFFNVVQPMLMPMVRRRKPGRIVVVSSVSGVMGNRGQVNYSAAKAGLIGAAKALAVELASRAITVNAVAPGLIDTGMVTEEVKKYALPAIPMRRTGTPQEVAALIAFLMKPEAGYITRQVIQINGGLS